MKETAQVAVRKRKRGPKPSTVIAIVVLVAGIGVVAYPTVADWWNSYNQSRAIATYVATVESIDPADKQKMLDDAHAYNERLLADPNRYNMNDEELAEYESLLNPTGKGIMGYVQINSIGVDYPIYHGMDEKVLQVAIGHLEGTSLPVGGDSTHAVISGHRGMPSAKLFTNLDRLTEGDTFTITVLDQTITYEVDQIRVVLPEDLSELEIVRGADLFTLITCTPYGINTHRLLVRGHRIDNIIGADVVVADAIPIPRYIAVPAVGVPILFLFLLCMLVYYRTRPVMDMEKAAEILRQRVRNGANNGNNGSGNEESKYDSSGKGQRR